MTIEEKQEVDEIKVLEIDEDQAMILQTFA
jgi:hypothetical protein